LRRNRYSRPPDVPAKPTSVHSEHCPFCGADFDPRDLGQVLEHYDHQVAAGVPAIDETSEDSIEIKDTETGQTVVLAAADWDENDKRVAVAQVIRLAGVPDGTCFLDEVAPTSEPRKA
jgi:hypothetical protein